MNIIVLIFFEANQYGCNLWMTPLILCSFLTWSMWKFFGQNLHLCHVEREIDGFPRVGIQELLGLKCVTNPPLCWRFLWTLCHNGVKLFLKEHSIFLLQPYFEIHKFSFYNQDAIPVFILIKRYWPTFLSLAIYSKQEVVWCYSKSN